jgi:hypothetical protein
VPTKIHQGYVALLQRSGEPAERFFEGASIQVDHEFRGEAELGEAVMDRSSIAYGPDDAPEISVVLNADNKMLGGAAPGPRQCRAT